MERNCEAVARGREHVSLVLGGDTAQDAVVQCEAVVADFSTDAPKLERS
jgi:hypothetical protein